MQTVPSVASGKGFVDCRRQSDSENDYCERGDTQQRDRKPGPPRSSRAGKCDGLIWHGMDSSLLQKGE